MSEPPPTYPQASPQALRGTGKCACFHPAIKSLQFIHSAFPSEKRDFSLWLARVDN
jgi:hypothetical protein